MTDTSPPAFPVLRAQPLAFALTVLAPLGAGAFMIGAVTSVADCKASAVPTLLEAGPSVIGENCKLLEGITQNQTVISICATIEEIAIAIATILPLLGTTADAGTCKIIPTTTVCATPEQLGRGIVAIVQHRQARLRIDGGVP